MTPHTPKAIHHTDWTPDRVETLTTMFNEGAAISAISKVTGVGKSSVHRKIEALGLSRPTRVKPMTPEREEELRFLWNAGDTYDTIASVMGVSRDWVSKQRLALSLPKRVIPAEKRISAATQAPNWTRAEIDRVVALWQAGEGATSIGRKVGKSRSAIIGKMHRMGLGRPGEPNNEASRVMHKVRARREPAKVTRTSANTRTIQVPVIPLPPGTPEPVPTTARPFLSVRSGECRWPLGERHAVLACCGPVARGAYCAEHAARSYEVPARAKKQALNTPASIEAMARHTTHRERIDPAVVKRGPSIVTGWDEGRGA